MRTILGLLGKMPRPTPAMGVALLALIIAAGGVAVAAIPSSNGTVIVCYGKDGTGLRMIDAESGTVCDPKKETRLGLASVDSQGKVANADKVDGQDSGDFAPISQAPMWAVVEEDGTTTHGRDTTGSRRFEAGYYEVGFKRDVSECAVSATLAKVYHQGPRDISTSTIGSRVEVQTREATGDLTPDAPFYDSFLLADTRFHLVVFC